jgi:hypothetical protein
MKSCTKCGAEHDRNHCWCKPCHLAYNREWCKRNREVRNRWEREWRRKNSAKAKAIKAVQREVERGRMSRPFTCSECGMSCKPQGHHDDYAKPLEVRWLCIPCHQRVHEDVAA